MPVSIVQTLSSAHLQKFFAGFIQETEVRGFINKSDGEPAMKSLKDAAAKALSRVERALDRNRQWEITKRMVTSSQL